MHVAQVMGRIGRLVPHKHSVVITGLACSAKPSVELEANGTNGTGQCSADDVTKHVNDVRCRNLTRRVETEDPPMRQICIGHFSGALSG